MSRRKQVFEGVRSPRVNLLPECQQAELRHRATLPKLAIALLASALIAAALWGVGAFSVMQAEAALAEVTAESAALQAEAERYGDAQLLLTEIGGRIADRETLTEPEVLFVELRDDLIRLLPDGSAMSGFAASLPGSDPAADAAAEPTAGCTGSGASVRLTLTTAGPAGLSAASQFLAAVEESAAYECGSLVDHRVLTVGDDQVSETIVQLGFDETVRALRFAEEGDS